MELEPSSPDDSGVEARRSTGRQSGLCGCLAAIVFAVPVYLVVWLGTLLGECDSPYDCHRNDHRVLLAVAAVLALAGLVGFAVRALAAWAARRRIDPGRAGALPVWAVIVLTPLALIGLWCAWAILPLFLD